MTSLPASTFQLQESGLLKPGAYADIVIFDPQTVRDTATFEEPHHLAEGFTNVIVNGTPIGRSAAPRGAPLNGYERATRPGLACA